MAVIIDLAVSYDQSTTNKTWFAEGVHRISPGDTPLQLLLPKQQISSTNPSWDEHSLTSQVAALATAVTAGAVTFVVTGASDRIPTDVSTYNVPALIGTEYVLVTALTGSTTLTVTRGHASSTSATHAAADELFILAPVLLENDDAQASFIQGRTKETNYVQEFEKIVEISELQEAVEKEGGVTSEMDFDTMAAMQEIALQLEIAMILNPAAAVGTKTTKASMGGLLGTISTNKTSDSGSIDIAAIQADIRSCVRAGGRPNLLLTSLQLGQDIANLYKDRIRTDVLNTIGGVMITTIVDPLAKNPIVVLPHNLCPAGTYFMLDTTRLAVLWLIAFKQDRLAKTKRAAKNMINGAYSIKIANEEAHACRYGFS